MSLLFLQDPLAPNVGLLDKVSSKWWRSTSSTARGFTLLRWSCSVSGNHLSKTKAMTHIFSSTLWYCSIIYSRIYCLCPLSKTNSWSKDKTSKTKFCNKRKWPNKGETKMTVNLKMAAAVGKVQPLAEQQQERTDQRLTRPTKGRRIRIIWERLITPSILKQWISPSPLLN